MIKEPVLKVEYQKVFDKYAVKIIYQNEKILKRGIFNDCGIRSVYCVAYFDNIFYIRGTYADWDEDIIIITKDQLQDIIKNVDKVNKKYGTIKRWRANKNQYYYCISGDFCVYKTLECFTEGDNKKYELGNYFKTEQEARRVLDSVQWRRLWEDAREDKLQFGV